MIWMEVAMLELKWEKNCIIEKLEKAQKEKRKIYIYGCEELGRIVWHALANHNIEFEAFCVDSIFYGNGGFIEGKAIENVERVIQESNQDNRSVLVIAFRDCDGKKLEKFSEKVEIINEDVFCFHTVDGKRDVWSKAFFEKHKSELSETYDSLEDEKSRECMLSFLYQKMTGSFKYLQDVYEQNQYYDGEIVDFKMIGSYVDCGAYDGDSFLAFARNYKKNAGKEYEGKAYLLEPDEENYQKMVDNCKDYSNCSFCKVGAWNEKKTLVFSSGTGTSSGVVETGDSTIEADTIDNLTGKKADFIKMDIEGAELEALQGAKDTICNCHPVLAICVYHKSDDLWVIPQYIKSIDSTYRFYLRAYSRYSQELVLYAV